MQQDSDDRSQVIRRLLDPSAVAIVGASADLTKINGRPLDHLIGKGYAGRILPVNPKYEEIAGLTCYPSIAALPEAADLAIVALPAIHVRDCVQQLGARGIRAAVVFSSGFGEMGDAGKRLECELVRTAADAGVVLLGPNCLGFINAFENVYATFSQYADGETGSGPIAFVTQSGAFGTAIAALVRQRGLGLGYFLNTGNQADLDFAELMMAVIEDPRITVAAGYLEGVSDGQALIRLARRCRELGKPLILTKVGRKEAGARAAASHTGALAVADTVFDAVIRQHGVLRARNEEQMLDMLEVFCRERRASGRGLGIATQSGGAGVMMADRAEEVGLEVPQLGTETQARISAVMPAFGATANPVDVTGQFVARPELLTESVTALMDDDSIHVVIVWLQLMTGHVDKLVAIFEEIQERSTKPFLVCWVAAPEAVTSRLRQAGIPVFGAGERAVEAAAALARFGSFPAPAATVSSEFPAPDLSTRPPGAQPTVLASQWLREIGVPMVDAELAEREDEAVEAWQRIGAPVALKIESPDILHKTEIGGVSLGLDSEEAVRREFCRIMDAAGTHAPTAALSGILVQRMSSGHVEIVLGVRRDPTFGMIVMVGLGGIFVEVLKDVTFRQAPFGSDEGMAMLDELRGAAVLDGVRGGPPVDRDALARTLAAVSVLASSMKDRLEELDLNPVLVSEDSISVVDCVAILR